MGEGPGVRAGFTLLELLIAIAILGTIFSVIYVTFATTIETKQSVERGNDLYSAARLTMDRLTRELSMAFVRAHARRDEKDPTIFLGEDHESGGYPMDVLTFTSLSHVRLGVGARESDQNKVNYFLVDRSDTGDRSLMYREDTTPHAQTADGGVVYELCPSVYGINYRYYDGEKDEWVDEWDSTAIDPDHERLPRAVEITLILRGVRDQEMIYQTKVMVHQ